jgi:FkbM family methyltransferase
MKYIFFDVGANNGSSSIHVSNNDNAIVYAFEPTPQMIESIKAQTSHLQNYILIEKAVSDYNGRTTFNVSGQGDWGCSSLLESSPLAKTNWGDRTDIFTTHTIEVDVIRLDTFIEEHNIPHIDYLHVDTQGSDLAVLKSLGNYINIVKQGVVEAANKMDILYKNQNTKEETIEFLEKAGFEILHIESNDIQDNEVNIYFQKITEQPQESSGNPNI